MIDKPEIIDTTPRLGLNPHVVEKDFVLGWILAGTYQHPALSERRGTGRTNMMRTMLARGLLTSLLLLCVIGSTDAETTPTPGAATFDCVDAFDVIAVATTLRCQVAGPQLDVEQLIPAALARLLASGHVQQSVLDDVTIAWCPLTHALGFTPSRQRIYLDAGLRAGTVDLVAEVLAHELVHVRQFRALGTDGFKCAYIKAFIDCGACQDERNRFEAEAYAAQARVRAHMLERWLHRGE